LFLVLPALPEEEVPITALTLYYCYYRCSKTRAAVAYCCCANCCWYVRL